MTRLFKDGIGSAYRAAKAASACAVLQGIAASDFERNYAPFCRGIEADNFLGRFVFSSAHIVQHVRFIRHAVLAMTAAEQRPPGKTPYMSSVLWDMFTGSAPYREVLQRAIHPAFSGRLARSLVYSFAGSLQMFF